MYRQIILISDIELILGRELIRYLLHSSARRRTGIY